MISDDPEFTDPAMDVIRRIDPETYNQINDDSGWNVSTGDRPRHEDADAVTPASVPGRRLSRNERYTILDPLQITTGAADLGVPVADFAASILVHEFTHHLSGKLEEVPAYQASVRFDLLLPPRDLGILREDLEALREEQQGI